MWYCIPSRESRNFLFSSSLTNISGCLLLDKIPRISCRIAKWVASQLSMRVPAASMIDWGRLGRWTEGIMQGNDAGSETSNCKAQQGICQWCRHEEVGPHLAPCNDGANQGPCIRHGKEVAVLRCRVSRQQPHIEEERQLRLHELPCSVCVPAPCMSRWDVRAATSGRQPHRLEAVDRSWPRSDPTARRMTPNTDHMQRSDAVESIWQRHPL